MDRKLIDEKFMEIALSLAKKGAESGEIPVGALVVRNGEIISKAFNHRENGKSATAHAEILAIDEACRKLGTWRLSDCDIYVTLEPCPMCAGAIINARMRRVVFGAKDYRGGAMGSLLNLNSYPLGHKAIVESGVLENECLDVLKDFFKNTRENKDN